MPLLVFALLCLFWGFSWVAIKLTLEGIPPFAGAGLRFLIALPILVLFVLVRRRSFSVPGNQLLVIAATGILVYGFDYGLIYWGEQYISAGLTALFFASFPFFTGILSHFVFRSEDYRASIYVGLAVGFAGMFVVFYDEMLQARFDPMIMLAVGAIILGALSAALGTVLVKVHLSDTPPVLLTFYQLLIGSPLLISLGWLRSEFAVIEWSWRAVFGLLYLGILASAVSFVLYYWLLKRTSAVTVSSMIYVTPLVALFFDWLVYGRVLTATQLIGTGMILTGISISELPRYRRPEIPPASGP